MRRIARNTAGRRGRIGRVKSTFVREACGEIPSQKRVSKAQYDEGIGPHLMVTCATLPSCILPSVSSALFQAWALIESYQMVQYFTLPAHLILPT